MSAQGQQRHPQQMHKPYFPQVASLGGVPTVKVDVPISAVFLFLFIISAAAHMTIFQLNKRKGHKFVISGMMFGFSMARITACILRIAWATRPTHIPLAIAAQIFVAAGVVLMFVINLIFAQRILRGAQPFIGWHKLSKIPFTFLYALIVVSLVMLITCTVQSFYTLNRNTHRIDRDVQLYGQTIFAIMSFLPIPIVLICNLVPKHAEWEKFGGGRWRTKMWIILVGAVLLCLGATFRCGTNYKTPRPRTDPAWYHSKACFYLFNFTIEITVLYLYAITRVDQRFHVPDGSKGPGDYSKRLGGAVSEHMSEIDMEENRSVKDQHHHAHDKDPSTGGDDLQR
ncbi:hypothetical protein L228DRAFT_271210 [Xylona heveae TC161]|uniref:Uncharacterized protein n=1 Tax=Xylona heveae (strain CBS 132557 / TC161) TaxID=1328760 RepID=A0A164ZQY1_XYLHT|nr:hypothetical protein L228DRAFT_271210 [Xylona heveae TC161]KZF19396.1 hypothetical protein L228DRAFT_271210 [Xylona heveae TC161]